MSIEDLQLIYVLCRHNKERHHHLVSRALKRTLLYSVGGKIFPAGAAARCEIDVDNPESRLDPTDSAAVVDFVLEKYPEPAKEPAPPVETAPVAEHRFVIASGNPFDGMRLFGDKTGQPWLDGNEATDTAERLLNNTGGDWYLIDLEALS